MSSQPLKSGCSCEEITCEEIPSPTRCEIQEQTQAGQDWQKMNRCSSEGQNLLIWCVISWKVETKTKRRRALWMSSKLLLSSRSNPLRWSSSEGEKVAPLCCLVFLSMSRQRKSLMASFPAPSYRLQQMSEGTLAASYLWGELLVMSGGTQDEHGLPKGRYINYSAWSFASAWAQMAAHERD